MNEKMAESKRDLLELGEGCDSAKTLTDMGSLYGCRFKILCSGRTKKAGGSRTPT